MNGEDTDLTMQIGRLGYRVVVDPRISSYEDVPRSPGEFVEQRTRWARRASTSSPGTCRRAAARLVPRVWFWTLRRGFSWFSIQAGLVAPIFLLELALTNPTYRAERGHVRGAVHRWAAAIPVAISLPYAVKYRYWRSILWAPTWFALRVPAPARHSRGGHLAAHPAVPGRGRAARRPAAPEPLPVRGPSGVSVGADQR